MSYVLPLPLIKVINRSLGHQMRAFSSPPCCSNPSTWSELDRNHLSNARQLPFLPSRNRRVVLHLERESSAKNRGQEDDVPSENGAFWVLVEASAVEATETCL